MESQAIQQQIMQQMMQQMTQEMKQIKLTRLREKEPMLASILCETPQTYVRALMNVSDGPIKSFNIIKTFEIHEPQKCTEDIYIDLPLYNSINFDYHRLVSYIYALHFIDMPEIRSSLFIGLQNILNNDLTLYRGKFNIIYDSTKSLDNYGKIADEQINKTKQNKHDQILKIIESLLLEYYDWMKIKIKNKTLDDLKKNYNIKEFREWFNIMKIMYRKFDQELYDILDQHFNISKKIEVTKPNIVLDTPVKIDDPVNITSKNDENEIDTDEIAKVAKIKKIDS